MTTITVDRAGPVPPGPWAPATRRRAALSLGTLGGVAATGLVLYEAVETLLGEHGLGTALAGGWATLVAPAFVVLVLVAVACERVWPAERRPLFARGHVQDAWYFLLYVLAIAPFMTLLSVGSAVVLGGHARWLQATWTASWPRWAVVVVTLVAMDLATGWRTGATTASARCGASTRCTIRKRS